MRNVLLAMIAMSSFVGQAMSSERDDQIAVFHANVGRLNYNPLRYCDKHYIDFLNDQYGMQCTYNEPFLRVYHLWVPEEQQRLHTELVKSITYMPYRFFMKDNKDPRNSSEFKKYDSILLSGSKQFTTTQNKFQIQLESDFGEMSPQHLLNQFKETPRCMPGHILNETGQLLPFVDTTDLEKEACEDGRIRKVGKDYGYGTGKQEYEQWINGYFGKEIKAEQKAKATALFYARIKKLLLGSSIITAIILYTLYQKFYITAS